jgi:hypothetical protein
VKTILYTLSLLFFMYAGTVLAEAEEEEEVLSGRELLAGCEEGAAPGAPNQYCMRYIFGLVQIVDRIQQADPGQKLFCINPQQVGLPEVTEKTTDWLNSVPERLDEDAYKLVSESLHNNYPCQLVDI